MIDFYDWPGGREAMLRFGPATGPVVVAALPLFEEANRTRTFTVTVLRCLAERGIAGALPDLPGQGESLMPLESLAFVQLLDAFESAVDLVLAEGRSAYVMGIRSGTLLDARARASGRWHLAPMDGSDLVRELEFIRRAGGAPSPAEEGAAIEIAGNRIAPDFLADIAYRTPFAEPSTPLRLVRLVTDPRSADRKIMNAPLWRRAEPDNDPELAAELADDIADWVRACER